MTLIEGNPEDLRVKRTQQLIVDALIELSAQKGFAAVTVSDITRAAGVNRATFYRHYQDKFDLLNQYAKAVFDLLDLPSDANALTPGLVLIFEHIRTRARFYRVMLGKQGDPVFTETIRQYIQKRIWRSLPVEVQRMGQNNRRVELYLNCSSSASVGAVLWWLEQGTPYSAEEMANISTQVGANLSALLTEVEG